MTEKRKLIEVALPLEAINIACKADKDRKTGTIRNLHKWFAPMPPPAWRALLAASLIDDPGDDRGRAELLELVAQLVASNTGVVNSALATTRSLIARDAGPELPVVLDPFCGGGSTLVEALRLGLPARGSDLNPVPVLITRVLTEVLPKLAHRSSLSNAGDLQLEWARSGVTGFTTDVRHYAQRVRDQVARDIGHHYPLGSSGEQVVAWLWARTATCPNPACRGVTPLVTSFWLSKAKGNSHALRPMRAQGRVSFEIQGGDSEPQAPPKVGRSSFQCLLCGGTTLTQDYLRAQGSEHRLGLQLVAIAAQRDGERVYLTADEKAESAATADPPPTVPEHSLPANTRWFSPPLYGMQTHAELYTPRQLVALDAFARAVSSVPQWVQEDGGHEDYGAAIAMVLGLCVGKLAQANSTLVRWRVRNGPSKAEPTFGRHDLPMVWDFAEVNPFGGSVGDWNQVVNTAVRAFDCVTVEEPAASVHQLDARVAGEGLTGQALVATDPPYFDNIGYADLSDYFYVWIRLALKDVQPDLFSTLLTPKTQELIATPIRHGGDKSAAKTYFVDGFTQTFRALAQAARSDLPLLIVYGFKQQESMLEGVAATGWDAILEAILRAGLAIRGTWPIRGTGSTRQIGLDRNSLADYVVLVVRPRSTTAPLGTRKEFLVALKSELPEAVLNLQQGNVAPVDLAQAAIGPGMAVFSRFSRVVEADGSVMAVRTALSLINQVLDEALSEQEADFDGDTRWAVAWFEQHGMNPGPFGVAETLSKAKNTAINGLVAAGILESKRGKVRLLDRTELPDTWDPAVDARLTVWEVAQHLIDALESGGEDEAAALLRKVGGLGETARELAYRLYVICERRKWAKEALAYNALVVSWPEISRLASTKRAPAEQAQQELL